MNDARTRDEMIGTVLAALCVAYAVSTMPGTSFAHEYIAYIAFVQLRRAAR